MAKNLEIQSITDESAPLEEKDKDKTTKETRNPNQELFYYAAEGNEEKIREVVLGGADVNASDPGESEADVNQNTHAEQRVAPKVTLNFPLHVAAENNQPKVISCLFYLGAKTENKNKIGSTPLHRAVSMGKLEAVTELLNLGADVHAQNSMGQTPLHISVLNGSLEITKLLLARGAASDLRVKNRIQYTPIEYTLPNSETRSFLVEYDSSLRELIVDDEPPSNPAEADEKKQM